MATLAGILSNQYEDNQLYGMSHPRDSTAEIHIISNSTLRTGVQRETRDAKRVCIAPRTTEIKLSGGLGATVERVRGNAIRQRIEHDREALV